MNWLKSIFIMTLSSPFVFAGYLFQAARSGFKAGIYWRKLHEDWFTDN